MCQPGTTAATKPCIHICIHTVAFFYMQRRYVSAGNNSGNQRYYGYCHYRGFKLCQAISQAPCPPCSTGATKQNTSVDGLDLSRQVPCRRNILVSAWSGLECCLSEAKSAVNRYLCCQGTTTVHETQSLTSILIFSSSLLVASNASPSSLTARASLRTVSKPFREGISKGNRSGVTHRILAEETGRAFRDGVWDRQSNGFSRKCFLCREIERVFVVGVSGTQMEYLNLHENIVHLCLLKNSSAFALRERRSTFPCDSLSVSSQSFRLPNMKHKCRKKK